MDKDTQTLVAIRNMSFSRGERKIFDNVNITIPKGKVTAIMGPSGIGKTTLLKLMGGQLVPDSGQVLFDNENLHDVSRSHLFKLRQRMSMLFPKWCIVYRHECRR